MPFRRNFRDIFVLKVNPTKKKGFRQESNVLEKQRDDRIAISFIKVSYVFLRL